MSTLKISINCPSYKRPKVETLDYLKTCKVWVAEREYEAYLHENPGFEANIISVPNEVQGNLCRIRNYILDHELAENDAELRNAIQTALATERGYNAHEKDSCDWEVAVFDGMPVGASITILTKMQNDVRTTEGQLIQYLMDRTDAGDLRVNKLNAYVIPNSNYVIRGGKYTAQIILAAVDSTQRPEYYIEGQRINDQGIYEAPYEMKVSDIKTIKIADYRQRLRDFNEKMPLLNNSKEKKNDSGYQDEILFGSNYYLFIEIVMRDMR